MQRTERPTVLIRGQYENADLASRIDGETSREALKKALETGVTDADPIMSVDPGDTITFLDADRDALPVSAGRPERCDHAPGGPA